MTEKRMTNVATKCLADYMGFFTFHRNWWVEHGHSPANLRDTESILEQLLAQKVTLTRPELEQMKRTLLRFHLGQYHLGDMKKDHFPWVTKQNDAAKFS